MSSKPSILDGEDSALLITSNSTGKRNLGKIWVVVGILLIVIVVIAIIGFSVQRKYVVPLDEMVTAANILVHLANLEDIANKHPSKSRSVLNAYNNSAEYVIGELAKINGFCDVSRDHFIAAIYKEESPGQLSVVSPVSINYQFMVDFRYFPYGGTGDKTIVGNVSEVTGFGCSLDDFNNITRGDIVLIPMTDSSDCRIWDKAYNAEASGASAAILYNPINRTALTRTRVIMNPNYGWLDGDPYVSIPIISTSYTLGLTLSSILKSSTTPVVSIVANQSITMAHTYNVICTTKQGLPDQNIVLGAHLDSVPEGPGINDNGSGSATVLEIAIQLSKLEKPPLNQITFAWWSAEEIGLVGSASYVRKLQLNNNTKNVAVMFNLDMVGSPNFVPIVTDGNNTGSKVLTALLNDYLTKKAGGAKLQSTAYGRTDFVPFDLVGIPIANLFTGAEGTKSREEAKQFGGVSYVSMDPCYHRSCDDLDNINSQGLGYMSSTAAHLVELLAQQENLRKFVSRDQQFSPTSYAEWTTTDYR